MTRTAPKNPTENANIAELDSVTARFLNSARSMSGWSARCSACRTNAVINAIPMSPGIHTWLSVKLSRRGTEEIPNSSDANPGDSKSIPTKSNASDGRGRSFGKINAASTSRITPTGRLIRKIHSQP